MSLNETQEVGRALKLNYKRTFIIGFAFFGILLMWQVYDNYASSFLSELFMDAFHTSNPEDVQYLVGMMMALDNLAALIMMPIFGNLSDKNNTKFNASSQVSMLKRLFHISNSKSLPKLPKISDIKNKKNKK